jgi:hypothetical protein
MSLKKLTPVLVVERIEPCLPFWRDRLGFTVTAEVPHGERLGFVILQRDAVEVMLQTRASVADDVGEPLRGTFRTVLFVEVADLAPLRAAVTGLPALFPERVTSYGATEIGVEDPAGNALIFAQFGAAAESP